MADPSPENVKKHEYALDHFKRVNDWLEKEGIATRYQFNMLSPKDFSKYFTKLKDRQLDGFRSDLDGKILEVETTG